MNNNKNLDTTLCPGTNSTQYMVMNGISNIESQFSFSIEIVKCTKECKSETEI